MLYEAIIFDLDGTAMPSAEFSLPSEELIKTTRKYREKIHLCAATGRSWQKARDVVLALGLIDPCVVSGGAVIIDPAKEKILWQKLIDPGSLKLILKAAQKYDYPVTCATGLTFFSRQPKEIPAFPIETNTIYILDIPGDKVGEVLEDLSGIEHITISKAYSWVLENGIDLHITNKQATKEHAVIELCRILGVNPVNTAGIGDGFNDVHLFNSVGHRVAMGNAVQDLKDLADEVIGSLDDNGLGKFIESSVQRDS